MMIVCKHEFMHCSACCDEEHAVMYREMSTLKDNYTALVQVNHDIQNQLNAASFGVAEYARMAVERNDAKAQRLHDAERLLRDIREQGCLEFLPTLLAIDIRDFLRRCDLEDDSHTKNA